MVPCLAVLNLHLSHSVDLWYQFGATKRIKQEHSSSFMMQARPVYSSCTNQVPTDCGKVIAWCCRGSESRYPSVGPGVEVFKISNLCLVLGIEGIPIRVSPLSTIDKQVVHGGVTFSSVHMVATHLPRHDPCPQLNPCVANQLDHWHSAESVCSLTLITCIFGTKNTDSH